MPETIYCGQCGHANPATHKFCTSCGLKISGAPAPRPPADRSSAPPKYEYHSETVRGGIFFTDSKVNKRVAQLAAQGWELVSNTEAHEGLFLGPGRNLQFRRQKPG